MRVEPPPAFLDQAHYPVPAVGNGRHLVPVSSASSAVTAGHLDEASRPPVNGDKVTQALAAVTGGLNIRKASPIEISNLSLDLYAAGVLSFDDYAVLAFQPELHPDFNRTIGALTGEAARPEGRRDFVTEWDERLQFDLRHRAGNSTTVQQTKRILQVLKHLANPTQIDI